MRCVLVHSGIAEHPSPSGIGMSAVPCCSGPRHSAVSFVITEGAIRWFSRGQVMKTNSPLVIPTGVVHLLSGSLHLHWSLSGLTGNEFMKIQKAGQLCGVQGHPYSQCKAMDTSGFQTSKLLQRYENCSSQSLNWDLQGWFPFCFWSAT